MALQLSHPAPWKDEYSDGCTGVLDWLPFVGDMTAACVAHDRAYYYGGGKTDKLKADLALERDIRACGGWLAWACAKWRYMAVRKFANSAFNWIGPGLPK